MKTLYQITLCLLGSLTFSASLFAEGCPLCDKIRAERDAHPQKYEYYEDYLKQEEKPQAIKEQSTPKEAKVTAPQSSNKENANKESSSEETPKDNVKKGNET